MPKLYDIFRIGRNSRRDRHQKMTKAMTSTDKSNHPSHTGEPGVFKYSYEALPPGYIRVLTLQPAGNPDENIVCELSSISLDGDCQYTALSYVWGDVTKRAEIRCGNAVVNITQSLRDALKRVRRMSSKPVAIWADAVCINQEDIRERERQVQLMGRIYGNASIVFAWIGPDGEDNAREVFSTIRSFNEIAAQQSDPFTLRQSILSIRPEDISEEEKPTWYAIANLFNRPWFFRTWVIQELGLAQLGCVLYGDERIFWPEILLFTSILSDTLIPDVFGIKSSRVFTTWQRFSLHKDDPGSDSVDLLDLMSGARGFSASNKRDYIYALFGHPSAAIDGQLIVPVNYSKSAAEVYTEFTRNIIVQQKTLRALSFVFHEEENSIGVLPSWVPSWDHNRDLTMLGASTKGPGFQASGVEPLGEVSFSGESIQLRGVIFDEIQCCSEPLTIDDLGLASPMEALTKGEKFGIFRFIDIWESIMGSDHTGIYDPATQGWSEFGLAMSAGRTGEVTKGDTDSVAQNNADFAAYIAHLVQMPGFTFGVRLGDNLPISILASSGNYQRFFRFARTSHNRRIFRTLEGRMGLGPKWMQPGDMCAVLFGGSVPFILRKYRAHYQLMGESYIYGAMHGEVVEIDRDRMCVQDLIIQ